MTWCLRLRGRGCPPQLELADGGTTTISKLNELVGQAVGAGENAVVLKAGFPPRVLNEEESKSIADAGLNNRDTLLVECQVAGAGMSSGPAPPIQANGMLAFAKVVKAAKAPAKVESASNIHTLTETKSRRKVPSATAAAADACTWASADDTRDTDFNPAAAEGSESCSRQVECKPKRRQPAQLAKAARRRKAQHAEPAEVTDFTLGGTRSRTADDMLQDKMANDLLQATSSSSLWDAEQTHLLKALRAGLNEARQKRGLEQQAHLRLAAAVAGNVALRAQGNKLQAEYTSSGYERKATIEEVTDLPPALLRAVLTSVATADDPAARQNLMPIHMALLSQRIFWAVVHHGGVVMGRSFREALQHVCPDVDWAFIESGREKKMPARLRDFDTTERAEDFDTDEAEAAPRTAQKQPKPATPAVDVQTRREAALRAAEARSHGMQAYITTAVAADTRSES